jgi:hypothetical protein
MWWGLIHETCLYFHGLCILICSRFSCDLLLIKKILHYLWGQVKVMQERRLSLQFT